MIVSVCYRRNYLKEQPIYYAANIYIYFEDLKFIIKIYPQYLPGGQCMTRRDSTGAPTA